MSEFTNNNERKIAKLLELAEVIINKQKPAEYVKANMETIEAIMPSDVIRLVHLLVEKGYAMEELKKHIAKLLNLFYKALNNYPIEPLEEGSLLHILQQNNEVMEQRLKAMKLAIKAINQGELEISKLESLASDFEQLQVYSQYFILKENLLFPVIEKHWPDYKCVQIMWSIHDDIRRYLKEIPQLLRTKDMDLDRFNLISSRLYFDVNAIQFRDNRILFPHLALTITKEEMQQLLHESADFEFPFVAAEPSKMNSAKESKPRIEGEVDLGSGSLNVEQLIMIFNHLPVDMTYVDEHDKVKFFSTPKHRIFPRSNAIIGRDVQNCHPPESVHIVEEIVKAFKKGEKDEAAFWIKMGPHFVLIKYFAVRNAQGEYRGVLEVSQEVSDIRALQGEQRLLDWE
jgi:hypothetical protein